MSFGCCPPPCSEAGSPRLWPEPGPRGQVSLWGPSPVTVRPPGSCREVVGPEADGLRPVLP